MPRLGIVTGLAFEAVTARTVTGRSAVAIACAAADSRRAEAAACTLIGKGCEALLSFGIAGGLDPRLSAGGVVLADSVVSARGERWPTDLAWRRRLASRLVHGIAVTEAPLLGVDAPVAGVSEKQMHRARSGAAALDMESHAVAAVAAQGGLPFIVLRVVADPAGRAVPVWLTAATDRQGRADPLAAITGLLRRPFDIGAVIRLARDVRRARKALSRAAFLAAPLFLLDA